MRSVWHYLRLAVFRRQRLDRIRLVPYQPNDQTAGDVDFRLHRGRLDAAGIHLLLSCDGRFPLPRLGGPVGRPRTQFALPLCDLRSLPRVGGEVGAACPPDRAAERRAIATAVRRTDRRGDLLAHLLLALLAPNLPQVVEDRHDRSWPPVKNT